MKNVDAERIEALKRKLDARNKTIKVLKAEIAMLKNQLFALGL